MVMMLMMLWQRELNLGVVPESWSAACKSSTFSRKPPLPILKPPDINCVMDTFFYKIWDIFVKNKFEKLCFPEDHTDRH